MAGLWLANQQNEWACHACAHLPDWAGEGSPMHKRPREEAREQHIEWEIVPDAHDAAGQGARWPSP